MTAEVIEVKRHPPIRSVNAKNGYKATFSGSDARAGAEEYTIANFGTFTVREKPALDARTVRA
jgi:hypothetical protein